MYFKINKWDHCEWWWLPHTQPSSIHGPLDLISRKPYIISVRCEASKYKCSQLEFLNWFRKTLWTILRQSAIWSMSWWFTKTLKTVTNWWKNNRLRTNTGSLYYVKIWSTPGLLSRHVSPVLFPSTALSPIPKAGWSNENIWKLANILHFDESSI